MNSLYIIGNGFDLAHGLKTSYNDFMLDYLKKAFLASKMYEPYNDELINLSCSRDYILTNGKDEFLRPFTSLNQFLSKIEEMDGIKLYFHSEFMKSIIQICTINNWVDIENLYFQELIKFSKSHPNIYTDKLKNLNSALGFLREKLFDYLSEVNSTIEIDFDSEQAKKITEILTSNVKENNRWTPDPSQSILLNFNYTDTVSQYINHMANNQVKEIKIHGSLNNRESIIFGYGDEMDEIFSEIERKNDNLFFEHLKSFGYFKTNSYQKIIHFLDSSFKGLTVHILGHSLGLSDRILLNQIFEHKNISKIKIYYYQNQFGIDDYIPKTYEISRHFKDKSRMRQIIVPKPDSSVIPQKSVNVNIEEPNLN